MKTDDVKAICELKDVEGEEDEAMEDGWDLITLDKWL